MTVCGRPHDVRVLCRVGAEMKVTVEPVVLTMAVRYCLGRSSYAPGLIAGEVIASWPNLGNQQEVILRDIWEWLHEEYHGHPEKEVWLWLLSQVAPQRCENCGKTMAEHDELAHCYPAGRAG